MSTVLYVDGAGRAFALAGPLSDPEAAARGLRRTDILPDGASFRTPVHLMDSLQLEIRNERTPTMQHQVYTADQLTALKDAETAAFDQSVARLNSWRNAVGAPAATAPRTHDAASEAAAFGKSVAVMNAWRNPTGA